jgi:hypothetical protein
MLVNNLNPPHLGAVATDFLLAAPLRTLRDGLRLVTKWAILLGGGKQALDRAKSLMLLISNKDK